MFKLCYRSRGTNGEEPPLAVWRGCLTRYIDDPVSLCLERKFMNVKARNIMDYLQNHIRGSVEMSENHYYYQYHIYSNGRHYSVTWSKGQLVNLTDEYLCNKSLYVLSETILNDFIK